MKFASFTHAGKAGYGLVTEGGIVDLARRFPDAPTLRTFIAGGLDRAAALVGVPADFALADVTLAPVIPDPDKIVCVGLNYHDHVVETGRTVTPNPMLFARYAGSQVGDGEALVKPLESDEFDYEGELAVIIGKGGRRISEADALSHVAGYACYNDASVRDWQRHTSQFMPGKTFAATGGFGPWMVSADEIGDPTRLTLATRLNGAEVQRTTVDLMITPIPTLIAYTSTILPLLPGDVIVSGTPGGVGARRTPKLFMKDGDVVEVEVSGIGVLRNPVVAEKA
ncbi:2-keto-4-pentenoate hydratase/2-oxohepta-3-ene-1,7-dioic acid hydratase in catechol pathway [Xanthobacter flavus]|uniref:2-keto-4-pentenoate hydratase/2-oxohepta-3-ene-1,7-dioic acid hydratase in catechol pathway n=1 Tax=Xanthobacter flavus TaxID=281 RepID=A0A9W6CRG7_XANFL|nr:fumarylacetoacetate hydrolase family protein [Xanthobacter flavus]MDR6336530.1 2-keto-4-pentenoate hydratase/2-oxohepta-3-ene-1,7-dioic acid hydratase in catechol pathway [Xanthobacter flavus]GLI25105.1 5-carboxymethyl-2-hydroxymuconate isomerase [Xanthobacter flavus]